MIFKGDGSLDAHSERLYERLQLFWTSHMQGYLMEPNRDNEDFKETVRNVKKDLTGPKRANKEKWVVFKRDNSHNCIKGHPYEVLGSLKHQIVNQK